jgi:hypothetical protein
LEAGTLLLDWRRGKLSTNQHTVEKTELGGVCQR